MLRSFSRLSVISNSVDKRHSLALQEAQGMATRSRRLATAVSKVSFADKRRFLRSSGTMQAYDDDQFEAHCIAQALDHEADASEMHHAYKLNAAFNRFEGLQ